jgi:hypothetical protein
MQLSSCYQRHLFRQAHQLVRESYTKSRYKTQLHILRPLNSHITPQ